MATAGQTIERPRVERPAGPEPKRRPSAMPIAVVAAALLGLLAGFLLWGTGETESTDAVAILGDDLTSRQEQMVELIAEYEAAWRASDGDAAAAFFTDDGVGLFLGSEVPVDGGALANYVSSSRLPGLDVIEPLLIGENLMLNFHRLSESSGLYTNIVEFTPDGELLIVRHEIQN